MGREPKDKNQLIEHKTKGQERTKVREKKKPDSEIRLKTEQSEKYTKHSRTSGSEYDNKDMIYGKNAVYEALLSQHECMRLYITDSLRQTPSVKQVLELAYKQGAAVQSIPEERMDSMILNERQKQKGQATGKVRHGGIMGIFTGKRFISLEELLEVSIVKGKPPFIIIADEIEDPHNLGAIIRTAEAAGADGVVIPRHRSAEVGPTVYATSAGAASWVNLCRVTNIVEMIKTLKEKNVWIYGADAKGEPMHKLDFTGGVALVIGSEGRGLNRLVREHCDFVVSIDMYGKINSLNASVSAGILMYEIVRTRRG